MNTHYGHVLAATVQRTSKELGVHQTYAIEHPSEGTVIEDITGMPSSEYLSPEPGQIVVKVQGKQSDFDAWNADPNVVVLFQEPLEAD